MAADVRECPAMAEVTARTFADSLRRPGRPRRPRRPRRIGAVETDWEGSGRPIRIGTAGANRERVGSVGRISRRRNPTSNSNFGPCLTSDYAALIRPTDLSISEFHWQPRSTSTSCFRVDSCLDRSPMSLRRPGEIGSESWRHGVRFRASNPDFGKRRVETPRVSSATGFSRKEAPTPRPAAPLRPVSPPSRVAPDPGIHGRSATARHCAPVGATMPRR